MREEKWNSFYFAVGLLLSFVLWTLLICFIDVKEIGPKGSVVGFATVNRFIHSLIGVNMLLYNITDWLGLVPICVCIGFSMLGLTQWIRRRHILRVDYSIFALGGFYILVIAAYILFEFVVINYRPTLINGYLETSYPSSTTMLVMTVMPTAIMQFNSRIKNKTFRKCLSLTIRAFIVFMVVGRIISGVHWISDIIGGILLSLGLVMLYRFVVSLEKR